MAKPSAKKHHAPVKKSVNKLQYLYWLILFAVPFLLYAQTIGFDFSYHDDDVMILDSAYSLETFSLKDFIETDAWLRRANIELYRPWQSITYAFDYSIAGTEPYMYHLHNIIVFSGSMVLLFLFLQQLQFSVFSAFILALFYSVHYLMSHAACWIPARGDVYLVFFGLLTLLLFIKWLEKGKIVFLLISIFIFFMSLLAKESAVMILPLMALLFIYLKQPSFLPFKNWWWGVPFSVVVVIYLQLRKDAVVETPFMGFHALTYNFPTIPEEVLKFFVPLFYSVMPGYNTTATLAGSVVIIVLAALVYVRRKEVNLKIMLIGLSIFLLPLLPSLFYKPVFVGSSYDYLDHRMFFCGIGLLIITGELLKKYIAAENRNVRIAAFTIIGISAVVSFLYADTYKNYNNFYSNAIASNPTSGLALTNYSNLLYNKEQKYKEAIKLIDRAIALSPDSSYYTFKKCGYAYLEKDIPVTKETSETLIRKWPNKFDSNFMRGSYFLLIKDFENSIIYSTRAIEIEPAKSDAYFNRALAYKELQKNENALSDFTKSLQLSPQFANGYFQRGNLYGNMGNFTEALKDFNFYVSLSPNDALGYFYRGQAYCVTGNTLNGCNDLRKAKQMGLPDVDNLIQRFCK